MQFLDVLNDKANIKILKGEQSIKPVILTAIGNMFTQYMCSTRFGYYDEEFNNVVRIFDEIFWDINQGYALDFLPWLKPFYSRHLNRLRSWSDLVREFILEKIIHKRQQNLDDDEDPKDFTDALLMHLKSKDSTLSKDHVIFELEDFLGGHSAIGNLVMMVLFYVVSHPEVQSKIQEECDVFLEEKFENEEPEVVTIDDRPKLPYTEAVIWETLRISSSPIVPHVAVCNTDIDGYPVAKNTVVFVNNHNLNLSKSFWGEDSCQFRPDRFLKEEQQADKSIITKVVKPEHFLPFSTGKRTCIGQKLVQGLAFIVLTTLLSKFDIRAPPGVDIRKTLKPNCLAIPPDCFNLVLTPRGTRFLKDTQLR